jgi:hypothetical protein
MIRQANSSLFNRELIPRKPISGRIRRMKPNTAYERAIKTIIQFERETAGTVSITGTVFCEALSRSFAHFAGDDSFAVIQRSKDSIQKIPLLSEKGDSLFLAGDLSKWDDTLKANQFAVVKDNNGSLVNRKFKSWMIVPIPVKKETFIAVVIARKKGYFRNNEIKAAQELRDYFTQTLRNIRAKNKKTQAIADDARRGILLKTQRDLGLKLGEYRGLAHVTDFESRMGSDLAQAWESRDENLLVCACDLTASEMERQAGLIYLSTWFSILAQTSLGARDMMTRLNADMVKREAECYAAIALIRYSRNSGNAEISGCGNATVVYFNHDTMDARTFEFGPASGISVENGIHAYSVAAKSGDILCAFTDGISGTKKRNGELFGDAGVCEIVKKNYFLSAQDLASKIFAVLREKEEKGVNADDRTLQVLKIE